METREIVVLPNGDTFNLEGERIFIETETQRQAKARQKEGYKKKLHMEAEKERKKVIKSNIQFVNIDMDSIDDVMKSLTRAERGLLVIFLCYLDYDNTLVIKVKSGKRYIQKSDLMRIWNIPKSTLNKFIRKCENYDFMHYEEGQKCFCISKDIAMKGAYKGSGRNLVSMRVDNLRKYKCELKPVQIGMLYDLTKFIQEDTMFLCSNPQERNIDKLKKLNETQLAEHLGVNISTIKRQLKYLLMGRQYVIAKVPKGKEIGFIVNPNFFFRGDYCESCERVGATSRKTVSMIFKAKR